VKAVPRFVLSPDGDVIDEYSGEAVYARFPDRRMPFTVDGLTGEPALDGRKFDPNEDVHHINGNKADNRLENLRVITHGEHSRLSNLTRTRGEAVITHTEGTSGHEQPE
jgi:hypothetical protein